MSVHRIAFGVVIAAGLAIPALAQAPRPPPAVAQKIEVMKTACEVVGGKPGGGAYIFVYDFTGDGVNDYLLSEGNYNCIGKPEAFRPGGRAVVEIYVTRGGDAPRAFYETVRGYRIVEGRPRVVQIVREGAACGPGARGTCTVSLRWDAATRKFISGSAPAANPPAAAAPPAASAGGVLSATDVRSQIVGRRVALDDGGMTWFYYPTGKYDADDGRNPRGGTYVVRPDGRLCWTEATGTSGCFQYYRKAGKLNVRRADPDNTYEVGAVTTGPL
jgi:hypothetical protein